MDGKTGLSDRESHVEELAVVGDNSGHGVVGDPAILED